jgi:hypothetical protein
MYLEGGQSPLHPLHPYLRNWFYMRYTFQIFLMLIILLRNQITRGCEYWIGLFVGFIFSEKSNEIQALLSKHRHVLKKDYTKSILSGSSIRLKKKKKNTNIKGSPDLNITKNFVCKFWAWIKENIWVVSPWYVL